MKRITLILTFICISFNVLAQTDGPKEVTPQMLIQIKLSVEKQVVAYKKKLNVKDLTADAIEFSVDTFRINKICSRRMEIDYSTAGTNNAVSEVTDGYDKLMNKYYNKLLKLLKPEDKKVLITAQKAWLVFRNSEFKFIGTMMKNEYSGGGTIQSNIAVSHYSDLVVNRSIQIFNYYDTITGEK